MEWLNLVAKLVQLDWVLPLVGGGAAIWFAWSGYRDSKEKRKVNRESTKTAEAHHESNSSSDRTIADYFKRNRVRR